MSVPRCPLESSSGEQQYSGVLDVSRVVQYSNSGGESATRRDGGEAHKHLPAQVTYISMFHATFNGQRITHGTKAFR